MAAGWRTEREAGWALVDASSDEVVGRVGLRMELFYGHAECSYWVIPSHRGKGLAPRAVDTLSRWALDEVGFERLRRGAFDGAIQRANFPECFC